MTKHKDSSHPHSTPAPEQKGAVQGIPSGEVVGTPSVSQTPPPGPGGTGTPGAGTGQGRGPVEPQPHPQDPIEQAKGQAGDGTAEPPQDGEKAKHKDVNATKPSTDVQPPADSRLATVKAKKGAPRYRIDNPSRVTVSWGNPSVECRFNPGDVITEDSYGDGAIERFVNAGLKLTRVDDNGNEIKPSDEDSSKGTTASHG